MNKEFLKNIVINNFSLGLQFGSRWLMNIVLLISLGIVPFGTFSFVYSFANILVSVLPFGSQFFLIKEVNENKDNSKTLLSSFIVLTFFSLLAFIILFVIDVANLNKYGFLIYLGLLLGILFSINTIFYSFLKGIGKFYIELQSNIVFSILVFLLTAYIYFINVLDVQIIMIYLIIFNLVTISFLIYQARNEFSYHLIKGLFCKESLKTIWQERKYYGFQDIVTASFLQGGMLILPLFIADDIYGEYRALLLLVAPFALLNLAFSQVLLNQIKNASDNEKMQIFGRLQKMAIPVLLIILGLMYFFKDIILTKLLKIENEPNINIAFLGVLMIILLSFIFAGYEMLLVAFNKQKIRFYIMIVGALANLLSIVILLPKYGIIGAIGTNVISTFVVFSLMIWVGEKRLIKKN